MGVAFSHIFVSFLSLFPLYRASIELPENQDMVIDDGKGGGAAPHRRTSTSDSCCTRQSKTLPKDVVTDKMYMGQCLLGSCGSVSARVVGNVVQGKIKIHIEEPQAYGRKFSRRSCRHDGASLLVSIEGDIPLHPNETFCQTTSSRTFIKTKAVDCFRHHGDFTAAYLAVRISFFLSFFFKQCFLLRSPWRPMWRKCSRAKLKLQ